MQRIFITGAGRGIGLELARQYVQRGDRVLAGCRSLERAPALRDLLTGHNGGLSVIPLEVKDTNSIVDAVRQAGKDIDGLDVLINNAAINPGDAQSMGPDGQPVLDASQANEILHVNAVAPVVVAQSFLALLRRGANPRVVNISSGAGSLTRKTDGGDYIYAASKAALNMFTRVLAGNMRGEGVTAVMINPGWVKTDMGGPNARLEPAESARGLLSVIDGLTLADSGRFLSYDGSELPW
ncbi:MAG TPA: SDR family oxidoreductase [Chloroflexota bacterium]|jgi:NAD(P)-dependent dehydrogenase (short-subunit alcohol dehydrogenase family)|nr:SDR family oxidoreductase [Chloroflexota bacterium]